MCTHVHVHAAGSEGIMPQSMRYLVFNRFDFLGFLRLRKFLGDDNDVWKQNIFVEMLTQRMNCMCNIHSFELRFVIPTNIHSYDSAFVHWNRQNFPNWSRLERLAKRKFHQQQFQRIHYDSIENYILLLSLFIRAYDIEIYTTWQHIFTEFVRV